MAPPQLTEEETDDLIYLARVGEDKELAEMLAQLADREGVSTAAILMAARGDGKSTCLHMASANGHVETVKRILEQFEPKPNGQDSADRQAFVDAPNEYGNTALHWAAMNGHLPVVALLVERGGASPALANDKNYVPLDLAGLADRADVVDYFFSRAASGQGEGGEEEEEGLGAAVEAVELREGGDDGEGEADEEADGEADSKEGKEDR